MPADRSRGSRRSGADGNQLVWTMPVEPLSPGGIAFATNLTPVTFNDMPSPCDDRESAAGPDSDPASRRGGHAKKRPKNHIPRPPNAFILFRSAFIKSQHVSTDVETNHSTLSKIIGLTWQNLPDNERKEWHDKAKLALDEHKRKFPQYAFRPLHTKDKRSDKRKVREVGPKDIKRCEKIAELLVAGKKGQELDAAIQEFDKHHVPEIVTRFEAPLTAQMYDNSSTSSDDEGDSSPAPRQRRGCRATATSRSNKMQSSPVSSSELRVDSVEDFSDALSPAFETYPSSTKQEPSFDFNTFSFDNITTSLPAFYCDPLASDNQIQFHGLYSNDFENNGRRRLSIDTSFMSVDSWTRSSSPLSPGSIPSTPGTCYADSPSSGCYSPMPPMTPMASCTPLSKSYDDLSSLVYPSNDCSQQLGYMHYQTDMSQVSFQPQLQHADNAIVGVPCQFSELDLDFSTFMASIPEYQQ